MLARPLLTFILKSRRQGSHRRLATYRAAAITAASVGPWSWPLSLSSLDKVSV
uniref:Uncharacterized protein n=1 Tax=Hyaloperonospora arabidopsidis (strain Emoy2) TaxID=559515 RepID=M4C4S5_HYAAE